jgi:hypothetical protein
LEENIFAEPIKGREKMWSAVQAAGGITDALRLTHESTTTDRCYLEWELAAVGQRLDGVSGIGFDGSGLVDFAAFHHRPLANLLAFSAEMGRRLGGSVGPCFTQLRRGADHLGAFWDSHGPSGNFRSIGARSSAIEREPLQHQAGENPEGITPI